MNPRNREIGPVGGNTPHEGGSCLELIDRYYEAALLGKQAGADRLLLRGMPGLYEARAAVIGCRSAGLPVDLLLELSALREEHRQEEGLAALLCLQELGIRSFGFAFSRGGTERAALELFAAIRPYAKIPLCCHGVEERAPLARAGVEYFWQEDGGLQRETAGVVPPRPEDAPLLLCDESGVYYLEEDFTLSEPITCSRDMLEEILEQEDQAFDALCFHVKNVDDAHFLGGNAHMVRSGVCILAEGEEALEMALVYYCGRALADSRSDVEDAALRRLAGAYGAIVR